MLQLAADQDSEWNATAAGSDLADAEADLTAGYKGAAVDFVDAIGEVLNGEYSLATASLKAGDAQLQKAQDALGRYNTAMASINATSASLDQRAAALLSQIDKTSELCHFDGSSTPTL